MNLMLAALLNGAIVGAVVAAAVWLGLRAAPRRALNAAARYWVWWAALAAAVLLPFAYLRVPPPSQAGVAIARPAEPARTSGAGEPAAPQVDDGPQVAQAALSSNPSAPPRGLRFPLVVAAGAGLRWIPEVWVAISSLMLMRLALSCVWLESRKARSFAAPRQFAGRIETWLAERGCAHRRVRLACSPDIGTPMLAGLRRPAILLPARLMAELQEEELDQIGLHEAAHAARRDDYALLVQRAIEALFALHPVVRWITSQIELEREIACDDMVVESTGIPRSYAACLTRMVELCGGVRAAWAGAPAGDRSQLSARVDRLLDQNRSAGTRPGKTRVGVAIGMVAALALVAVRAPGAIAFAMPAVAGERPGERPAEVALEESPPASSDAPQTPAPQVAQVAPRTVRAAVSSPVVSVRATVLDPLNRYVTGLGKENFRLFEDGVEQEISEFSSQDVPISAGIVVDMSGSMSDKVDRARLALAQFQNSANAEDEYFLVTFNDSVELAAGFTNDAGQIQRELTLARARGGTALREAIFRALQEMKTARNPDRILLVISDGNDNSSGLSQEDLRNAVRAARVQIYAVTLDGPRAADGRGQAFLGELADLSGGRQFVTDDPAKMPAVAASLAVRNQYVIGYQSKNTAHDGKFRGLRVEVTPPRGVPPLKVTVRDGYYAPI